MKFLLLALVVAVGTVSSVRAQPIKHKTPSVKRKTTNTMPVEVRAFFPTGATSLYLGELPMGVGGKPMLVHLWTAGRKPSSGASHQFAPSPFCVDVFSMDSQESDAPSKWFRVDSTVYLGEDGPSDRADVSVRWLYVLKKQSPVLVIVSPSYIATRTTVITYSKGFEDSVDSESYVQDFYLGGVGGGKILYDFGVDNRGILTVVNTSSVYGRNQSARVLAWNGHEYVANPAKPK